MMTWFDPHLPLLALSRSPGSREPSTLEDLQRVQRAGVRRVVCVQEAFELAMMDESLERRQQDVRDHGMTFTHDPIEDFHAPSLEQAWRVVQTIEQDFERGHKVLVHCQAGLGRAGTIAACLLCRAGMNAHDAIATTRFYRPGAVQSHEQELFVETFAKSF